MSRLNPLIAPVRHLRLIGDVRTVGTTVGIETRIPESEQWRQYRDNHQRGIKKLRKLGVTCAVEPWHESLEVFLGLYHETMKRVCADDSYYFNRGYFSGLCSATDFNARIYVCRYLGLPIAAGLFLFGSRFGHYHLGGTGGEFLHLAPTKLMFDTVRRDCATEGVEVFHLGGGIGGADDSLFKFKAGFSNTQYEYRVFSGVVDEFAYKSLVALRLRQAATVGKKLKQDYFPLYRAPLVDNTSGRT